MRLHPAHISFGIQHFQRDRPIERDNVASIVDNFHLLIRQGRALGFSCEETARLSKMLLDLGTGSMIEDDG
jgi:hypothetical protein